MPSSVVLNFTDPEQFERGVRASSIKETVTERGTYEGQLTKIDLHGLWMQRVRKTLPGVTHNAIHEGRVPILFPADMDQQLMLNSGSAVNAGEIICYVPGTEHHLRTPSGWRVATMSLPPDKLAKYGRALVGRELTAPAATCVVRPSSARMLRLMRLHKAASDLAKDTPDILAHPEVARAMAQELIRAMITCLTEGEAVSAVREWRRPVMKRFEEVLEAHHWEPIYLTDVCKEIGVSDRNLRVHCQEHLQMSPQRYLWLRRMNMARRALARAESGLSTVTEIASEYGFGELGRFSVQYRRLFGESPSVTLQRAPEEPRSFCGAILAAAHHNPAPM